VQNWKEKLVFLRVPELEHSISNGSLDKKSILQKISFQKNNSLANWLEKYLFENYNFKAVSGYADLQKNRKAVNEKGLLKNELYHERNEKNK